MLHVAHDMRDEELVSEMHHLHPGICCDSSRRFYQDLSVSFATDVAANCPKATDVNRHQGEVGDATKWQPFLECTYVDDVLDLHIFRIVHKPVDASMGLFRNATC